MHIIWLDQMEGQSVGLVGGKAIGLRATCAGAAIPPGFCLTTVAFEQWQAWQANATATQLPPPTLYTKLANAYAQLASLCGLESPPVAVRSSAVDEDGQNASFAGQYQTSLNVIGIEVAVVLGKN